MSRKIQEKTEAKKPEKRRPNGDQKMGKNPMVAGDLGPWSPVTMGFFPIFGRRSVVVSRLFFGHFSFFFLLYFSWHFSSFIGLIPLKKTCLEGMQIRAQSFLFFGKAEDFMPIFRQELKLGQTILEWPEIYGEASWAIDRTTPRILFKFWSRLGSPRC